MFVFQPTLSKAYITLFLSVSFLPPLFYWLYPFWLYQLLITVWPYNDTPPYEGAFGVIFSLTILISYIVACIVMIKLPRFWQPTLLKTILTLLFELIFYVVFISPNFVNYTSSISTISSGGMQHPFNTCPAGTQFEKLCGIRDPSYLGVGLVTASLTGAFLAYTLSCFIVSEMKNKKRGRK